MNRAPLPPASLLDEDQCFIPVDFGTREDCHSWAIYEGGAEGEVLCVVIVNEAGKDILCIEAADLSTLTRRGLDATCRNWIAKQAEDHYAQVWA